MFHCSTWYFKFVSRCAIPKQRLVQVFDISTGSAHNLNDFSQHKFLFKLSRQQIYDAFYGSYLFYFN